MVSTGRVDRQLHAEDDSWPRKTSVKKYKRTKSTHSLPKLQRRLLPDGL